LSLGRVGEVGANHHLTYRPVSVSVGGVGDPSIVPLEPMPLEGAHRIVSDEALRVAPPLVSENERQSAVSVPAEAATSSDMRDDFLSLAYMRQAEPIEDLVCILGGGADVVAQKHGTTVRDLKRQPSASTTLRLQLEALSALPGRLSSSASQSGTSVAAPSEHASRTHPLLSAADPPAGIDNPLAASPQLDISDASVQATARLHAALALGHRAADPQAVQALVKLAQEASSEVGAPTPERRYAAAPLHYAACLAVVRLLQVRLSEAFYSLW
jgi:hypothetical protein